MSYHLERHETRRRVAVWAVDDDWALLDEEEYVEINNWCKQTLGYHARSAYDVFDFRSDGDIAMFVLRWA